MTVTAAAADSRAVVVVTPGVDSNDVNGHQVALEAGANVVSVTVTAENASTGVYTVTVTRGPDTTPPLLISATVNGAALVLVYNENLDESSQPAPGAYAVKVTDSADDGAAAAVAVDTAVVADASVTLTLATPARNGDTVTVTYTPNAVVPLQDTAGNDAAAFDAQAVTNQTAAATDTKLSSLTLTADTELLTLTPVFAAGTGSYTAFVPNETRHG